IPNGNYTQKINIDEAETYGLEAGMTIPFLDVFSLGLNYTYTESEQKSGANKGAKLVNTPKHMANAVLNWQTTSKLKTWLKMEYRGERYRFLGKPSSLTGDDLAMYQQLGDTMDDYTLFNLGARYQVTKDFSVSATIYNLFDKDFLKRESYYNASNNLVYYTAPYSMEGRRLWVSFTYNF
ncbi:MAG: TonB-dependent receptor domain-containing protein, partial [Campylobacteraceae bacterium]